MFTAKKIKVSRRFQLQTPTQLEGHVEILESLKIRNFHRDGKNQSKFQLTHAQCFTIASLMKLDDQVGVFVEKVDEGDNPRFTVDELILYYRPEKEDKQKTGDETILISVAA